AGRRAGGRIRPAVGRSPRSGGEPVSVRVVAVYAGLPPVLFDVAPAEFGQPVMQPRGTFVSVGGPAARLGGPVAVTPRLLVRTLFELAGPSRSCVVHFVHRLPRPIQNELLRISLCGRPGRRPRGTSRDTVSVRTSPHVPCRLQAAPSLDLPQPSSPWLGALPTTGDRRDRCRRGRQGGISTSVVGLVHA